jgi:hypothetical protein
MRYLILVAVILLAGCQCGNSGKMAIERPEVHIHINLAQGE